MEEIQVLRTLRLKGRVDPAGLAAATGGSEADATTELSGLVDAELAKEAGAHFMLLPPGRERLEELLGAEREQVDTEAVGELYEQFSGVNSEFKQLANDWQLRDGEPNDHSDADYDQQVLDRLPAIHERVVPIVEGAAAIAPRLEPYSTRLTSALTSVQGGEHEWLLKPLIDSYHTVWFELHEELIGLAGLNRSDEAAAGRAE